MVLYDYWCHAWEADLWVLIHMRVSNTMNARTQSSSPSSERLLQLLYAILSQRMQARKVWCFIALHC